jgi:hypothetical protein
MYALGRKLDYRDMPAVRKIVHESALEDYRISGVIWRIVTSDPFMMRRVPEPEATIVAAQGAATQ